MGFFKAFFVLFVFIFFDVLFAIMAVDIW
jgi:hypothetical protein